jgi:mRNA guanylyltransferase
MDFIIIGGLSFSDCDRMILKNMELAYAVEKVVREDVPKLHHECDGLIYTNAEKGYAVGTDQSL